MMKSCILLYYCYYLLLLVPFSSAAPVLVVEGAFLSSRRRRRHDGTKRLLPAAAQEEADHHAADEAVSAAFVLSATARKDNNAATAPTSRWSRRSLLRNAAVTLLSGAVVFKGGARPPSVASAAEEEETATMSNRTNVGTKKPFAPVEALMPAIRVKRLIDRCVVLASELVQDGDSPSSVASTKQQQRIQELQTLLLKPQNFIDESSPIQDTPVPSQPAQSYLDAYNRNRAQLNVLQQPGALLVERGEILAWKRLKRQEYRAQQADAVRAALNLYTSRLTFSATEYVLQVPKQVRSQMIRNDALPDVKQVIQSDMGLRYLLRNEVLTSMADARAELLYQLQQQPQSDNSDSSIITMDARELLELLRQAQQGMDRWLSLIDDRDVRQAVEAVEQQQQQQQEPSI